MTRDVETLSTRDVAHALAVSESTLRRWADSGRLQVSKTVGGHRRIARTEVIRFVRGENLDIVHPESLGLTSTGDDVARDRPGDAMLDALVRGNADRARGVVTHSFLFGMSVAEIADQLIGPAMTQVGQMWLSDPAGIFLEHRATDIALHAVSELRSLLAPASPDAPLAMGGAPGDDQHMLTSTIAATVLQEAGWRSISLGARVPLETLRTAVTLVQPDQIWLSVTQPDLWPAVRRRWHTLLREFTSEGRLVVIGGQALDARQDADPSWRLLPSMGAYAGFLHGLHAARRASASAPGRDADASGASSPAPPSSEAGSAGSA